METIVATQNLTKIFGKLTAVNEVNLSVYRHDIYGFLGLNGAGKTTTLRMILGLVRPTYGRIFIFGKDLRQNFTKIMGSLGALIELPCYYSGLSAYQNLNILALSSEGITQKRIKDVLELVGLSERMHDKVKTFSQGMRQRLGIAMALLSEPELVILDEPTNGLDPQGIALIKQTILTMNREKGTTFIISSHLLYEVERICNRIGVIKDGKLIIEGKLSEFLDSLTISFRITTDPMTDAFTLLKKYSLAQEVKQVQDRVFEIKLKDQDPASLNEYLIKNGVKVTEISPVRMTLEEFLLKQ